MIGLPGADEVGVSAFERVWREVLVDGFGPGPMRSRIVIGIPRGKDLDEEVRLADTERGVLQAPPDKGAAQSLRVGTARYRTGLRAAAVKLADLDALKRDMTIDEATDMLWFFFGYASFFTLTEDNGWSPERAEVWLRDTQRTAC